MQGLAAPTRSCSKTSASYCRLPARLDRASLFCHPARPQHAWPNHSRREVRAMSILQGIMKGFGSGSGKASVSSRVASITREHFYVHLSPPTFPIQTPAQHTPLQPCRRPPSSWPPPSPSATTRRPGSSWRTLSGRSEPEEGAALRAYRSEARAHGSHREGA